ncbi:unnamed protein product [Brachionus calyciflorus]|uniref:Uncharacterized protein n=1 Tax=Brachionus calyciflorus TaxID=104777 RepID=A0A813QD36_9BILA|nr:unnamed protein product [Brachionus calyciflorus]
MKVVFFLALILLSCQVFLCQDSVMAESNAKPSILSVLEKTSEPTGVERQPMGCPFAGRCPYARRCPFLRMMNQDQ